MRNRDGFALEATILVMVLMSVLMLSAYTGAATATRSAHLDYRASRVSYAAEAGADAIIAQLSDALQDGYLDDSELSAITAPTVEGFTFSGILAEKIDTLMIETVTEGAYAGLYSLTQKIQITSEALDPLGNTSAVIISAKAQAFPVFQFGVFFEKDLEATNGPSMTFAGWVHSNGNIYLSSNNAWYKEPVTTPNKVYHDRKDNHSVYNGVYIADASANDVPLLFDSRTHSNPAAFRAESDLQFDNRLMTDAYSVDSLALPLPAGVSAYELLLPRDASDGPQEREGKYSWKADMSLVVDLANLSTHAAVCGGSGTVPPLPPSVNIGNVGISYTGLMCQGQTLTFTVTHPLLTCAEFDNRALLTIDADAWVTSNPMSGCVFNVTLPPGIARDFKIKIEASKDDYAQLTEDLLLDNVWTKEDIEAICGPGNSNVPSLLGGGGSTAPWPKLTMTRPAGLTVPDKEDLCTIFGWQWSAFYEGREQKDYEILNLDIQQLAAWTNGAADKVTQQIYVEFIVPANLAGYSQAAMDSLADGTLEPALRVRNGSVLPNPLSVSTHYPLYVQGDFNTSTWQPSSLVGDAISILSNAWDDADHQAQVIVKPAASNTTVYTAILAGHSATPCDHEDAGCPGGYTDFYGGGIENYPRFLENWSGKTLKFVGSLVSIHESVLAVGTWSGRPYSPPIRDWSFDTRFSLPQYLPPGTPVVGNVIHTAFRPVY